MPLPMEVLQHEHRLIERMLRVMESVARRLEKGEFVPIPLLENNLDFIVTFSDACHHAKEEDVLFPMLEGKGIPRGGGPIGVMMMEHEEGRRLVRGMKEGVQAYGGGEDAARGRIVQNFFAFVQLLRQHIYKEDQILYPLGTRVLSPADQEVLAKRFEDVEREKSGEGVHQRYETLVETLEEEWGKG